MDFNRFKPQCVAFSPRTCRLILIVGLLVLLGGDSSANEPAGNGRSPVVLAHYMPWYTAKPFNKNWGWHWTMNHFDPDVIKENRRQVASKYYPLIGAYDSADPDVLEYHLLLMKAAGIDGVIIDWYGLTDLHDYRILHDNTQQLITQVERLGMKFSICYEDQTLPVLIKAKRMQRDQSVDHVVYEFEWMAKHWFNRSSYVRLNDLPVVLSFGHAGLTNPEWTEAIGKLKSKVAYFSEQICRDGAVGGFDWPVPKQGVARTAQFAEIASPWQSSMPVVFPRFVDIYSTAKVRPSYPSIPDDDGATFRFSLSHALKSKAPFIQIATWNDWGEGTCIEPSIEFGYRDLEVLQAARRKHIDPKFAARPEDLRLPLALLRLRQAGRVSKDRLNSIASQLADGRIAAARAEIKILSTPRQ